MPAGRIVAVHGRNISISTYGEDLPITLPALTLRGLDMAANYIGHGFQFEVVDGQINFIHNGRQITGESPIPCLCHMSKSDDYQKLQALEGQGKLKELAS